ARVVQVAFSHDGTRVASVDNMGIVKLWDATTGKQTSEIRPPARSKANVSVSWSPDGKRLATAGGLSFCIWDTTSGKQVPPWVGGLFWSASWSPDGRRLACSNDNGEGEIRDALTGELILTLRGHSAGCLPAWSPDGMRLASASTDGTVKVW